MKLLTISVFWLSLYPAELFNFNQVSKNFSQLPTAVNEVINQIMLSDITTFNLITSEDSLEINDFKEEFLGKRLQLSGSIFRQELASRIVTVKGRRKRFSIFIIESFDQFTEIFKKLSPKIFWYNGFYLIVLIRGEIPEIKEIFQHLWKIQIFNVNVMYDATNGTIVVKTFAPFSNKQCNKTKPKLINEFKNSKFVNGVEDFFPQKMENLHKCSIRVSISNNSEPFSIVEYSPEGNLKITGQDIDFIHALAENMNFRINYSFVGPVGFFFENGSSDGPLRALLDGNADFSVSTWFLKIHRLKYFDSSTSYISESIRFIVPPGTEFTAFEKIVFPFQLSLWILILTCFVIAIVVIFVVKRRPMKVQNFVFGAKVKHPYLNILIGFIGETQRVTPRRNFARFMLMMFLMYSLVIRSLYQGSFFKLMQSNKQHKKVQSVEEMIKKNFKFYVPSGIADLLQGTEIMQNRSISIHFLHNFSST